MKIVLVGMPGVGKTTLGKKVAHALDFEFFDSDTYIETKYRISVTELFAKYGEKAFRNLEHHALLEILEFNDIVLSTGGGMPCFNQNMDIINKNALSFFLDIPLKMLVNRLIYAKKKRPLIIGKSATELNDFLEKTHSSRKMYYESAHFRIDAHSKDALSDILKKINEL